MENISKCILCLSDAKKVGYVLNLALDFDNMCRVGYYVVDEESEEVFLLRSENIVEQSFDSLVVEDVKKLEFCYSQNSELIGKETVSTSGLSLGRVEKVEFVGKKILKIVTGKAEILSKYIQKVSNDCVLVCCENKRKRKKRGNENFQSLHAKKSVVKIMQEERRGGFKPEKISLSADFYVGKVCEQDVVGYNNERIVSRGELISRAMVEKAKQHNRINQLFFSLKR